MTPDLVTWIREAYTEGWSLAEMAHECRVTVIAVAEVLGLDRAQSVRPWRQSLGGRGPRPTGFVGRMDIGVARARIARGESCSALAREAGVSRQRMHEVMRMTGRVADEQ